MSENELRALERAWRESGATDEGAALVRARLRLGVIETQRVEAAAFLGSELARAALDAPPAPSKEPDLVRSFSGLLEAGFGHALLDECVARAILACAFAAFADTLAAPSTRSEVWARDFVLRCASWAAEPEPEAGIEVWQTWSSERPELEGELPRLAIGLGKVLIEQIAERHRLDHVSTLTSGDHRATALRAALEVSQAKLATPEAEAQLRDTIHAEVWAWLLGDDPLSARLEPVASAAPGLAFARAFAELPLDWGPARPAQALPETRRGVELCGLLTTGLRVPGGRSIEAHVAAWVRSSDPHSSDLDTLREALLELEVPGLSLSTQQLDGLSRRRVRAQFFRGLELEAFAARGGDPQLVLDCALTQPQLRVLLLDEAAPPLIADDLARLSELSELRALGLAAPARDARPPLPAAAPLAGLQQLELLGLGGWALGEAALEQIAALPNLRSLSLARGQVTGLSSLADASSLEALDLSVWIQPVSPEDLEALSELPLRRLRLNLDATDAHLEVLATFGQLESLSLRSSQVSPAGLERLWKSTSLRHLNLHGCPGVPESALTSAPSQLSVVAPGDAYPISTPVGQDVGGAFWHDEVYYHRPEALPS